jgi:hypothetical protein
VPSGVSEAKLFAVWRNAHQNGWGWGWSIESMDCDPTGKMCFFTYSHNGGDGNHYYTNDITAKEPTWTIAHGSCSPGSRVKCGWGTNSWHTCIVFCGSGGPSQWYPGKG